MPDGETTRKAKPARDPSDWRFSEDGMAIWLGAALLLICAGFVSSTGGAPKASSRVKDWLSPPSKWSGDPVQAFFVKSEDGRVATWPRIITTGAALAGAFAAAVHVMGRFAARFIAGFLPLFGLAVLSFTLASQEVVNQYNLEYVLWGLVVGMIIANTVGCPAWLKPAVMGEFYIKTGLVLLGAEVLVGKLLALGLPGVCVSWLVTPVVLITTFVFGQRVLRISSPSLNMVISADMSVCGVSAAIATGAACRATKEELSCAIGLSLAFTAVMMVVQPAFIRAVDMEERIAGAWIGGTIDSTGAVAAAGVMVGKEAGEVAVVVKMIQNILIGVVAFGVAVYWTRHMPAPASTGAIDPPSSRAANDGSAGEIWRRFPKFILGFIAASLVFSLVAASGPTGDAWAKAATDGSKLIRGWLFCLAFVSLGLETRFRDLAPYFTGGKPLILYVCGQSLNLVLTFLMAWLMFGVVFPEWGR